MSDNQNIKVADACIQTLPEGVIISFKLDENEMNKFRKQADVTKCDTLREFVEQILNKAFYNDPLNSLESLMMKSICDSVFKNTDE